MHHRGVSWGNRRGRRAAAVVAVSASALASVAMWGGGGLPTAAASAGPLQAVIVQADDGGLAAAKTAVAELGGSVSTELGIINGFSAQVPATRVADLKAARGVRNVTPDSPVKLESYYDPANDAGSPVSVAKQIGADAFYKAGYFGQSIGIAVIDSGIVSVDGMGNNNMYAGPDLTPEDADANLHNKDTYGHGTAMASIVAGHSAYASRPYSDPSQYAGVAPEASLVSVKVADAMGNSTQSAIINAIDWCVQNRTSMMNLRVINLSLGADSGSGYLSDPMAAAVERAWSTGMVVVAAAGNDGGSQLLMPAADPYVIAVGATDSHGTVSTTDDTVASFSNKGNGTRNPDVVAPGTSIVAGRDTGSYIDQTYAAANAPTTSLLKGSGTSQASAIVSGAVALLLSKYQGLSPDQVKYWLTAKARPLANTTAQAAGAGLIDLSNLVYTDAYSAAAKQTWQRNSASYGSGNSTIPGWWGPNRIWADSLNSAPSSTSENTYGAAAPSPGLASARWTSARWTSARWTSARWTTTVWSANRWSSSTWR